MTIPGRLIDLLFPRRCPVCGQIVLPEGALICPGCMTKLHFIKQPSCKKCGTELISDREEYCPDCLRRHRSFECGVALIRYDTVAQKSMAAIKYKNRREYLDFYAEAIARRFGYFFSEKPDAVLIPVPVHPQRLKSRGFNQAGELAVRLGRLTGLSVDQSLLIRTRKTAPQKNLGPEERLRNLRHAFGVAEGADRAAGRIPERVILVDDIYTTGSTIEACTRVLLEAGCRQVFFASICIGSI